MNNHQTGEMIQHWWGKRPQCRVERPREPLFFNAKAQTRKGAKAGKEIEDGGRRQEDGEQALALSSAQYHSASRFFAPLRLCVFASIEWFRPSYAQPALPKRRNRPANAWVCLKCIVMIWGCVLFAGCNSPAWGNWDERVGTYTYNQAMHDLGRPKASEILPDGSIEAQWLVQKGQIGPANYYGMESSFGSPGSIGSLIAFQTYPAPNRYLRLTFNPNGRLVKWKRFYA